MSHPNAEDRKKYGFPDGSYPVYDQHTAMSAIKLRHHSDKHSAADVLNKVARWASDHSNQSVLRAVKKAREEDRT